ncbi:MAG: class I SAM-dependent methyltransferase [Bacteroidota bacterium]
MPTTPTSALQQFVQKNYNKNLAQLAFKKKLVEGYDNRFVLQQLHGKRKAKNKLPFLFNQPEVVYPATVSVEQSSSERTAAWKANLVDGDALLDMTGGFGVDTYHFAQKIKQVHYVEKNLDLFHVVLHNFKVLNANNITLRNEDSLNFLRNTQQIFDWIYLDPARRDDVGSRKIGLVGYFPNVLVINDLLNEKAKKVLLKVSPMLDIQQAIVQLQNVRRVIVLAVQNEVKELLLILDAKEDSVTERITLETVNLLKKETEIHYQSVVNRDLSNLNYSVPKKYLYEPNAAILKAGLFNEVAIDFNLAKLHPNTHLYTSDQLDANFPGRIFVCNAVENFNKKTVLPHLNKKKANITTRNFPYSVAQIKKKLGIKDGGNTYLFAATLPDDKLGILVCEKEIN